VLVLSSRLLFRRHPERHVLARCFQGQESGLIVALGRRNEQCMHDELPVESRTAPSPDGSS